MKNNHDPATVYILREMTKPSYMLWKAVSYTHLDVYKRQGHDLVLEKHLVKEIMGLELIWVL